MTIITTTIIPTPSLLLLLLLLPLIEYHPPTWVNHNWIWEMLSSRYSPTGVISIWTINILLYDIPNPKGGNDSSPSNNTNNNNNSLRRKSIGYLIKSLLFRRDLFRMEFDIFIPSLELAIEYQGQQHYEWNFRVGGSHLKQQKRDLEKQQVIYLSVYYLFIIYLSIYPSVPCLFICLFA